MSTLEWTFVAVIVGVLFVGGSMVAVWWWRLVARAAPYQDELERSKGQQERGRGDEGVVVVGKKGPQTPPPQGPTNGDVKS